MEKLELHILGCGSVLSTTRHFATSQVVNLRDKLFMIDCGEGAQTQLHESRLKFSRLNHIFISYLHGDHYFELMRPISIFGSLGRTAELHTHSPKELEKLSAPMFNFLCYTLAYKVTFHESDTRQASAIYEDRSMIVTTIPFQHRIPCRGFSFAEKIRSSHIIRDMIDFYKVSVYELNRIKNGADYITPEGEVIANVCLTRSSDPPKWYAYCSDTIFRWEIAEQISGVDLLFHEATFAKSELVRAKETYHTTVAQVGRTAMEADVRRLVIGHFSVRYGDENVLLKGASVIFPDTILAKENLCTSL